MDNNYEIEKVDTKELASQQREEIINSNHYAKAEIYVGMGNPVPSTSMTAHKCTDIELAKLAITLEQEAKYIYQTYPLTKSIAEQIEVKIIDFKGKEI